MSKNTVASGFYASDPIEGSSGATNDQTQGSKSPKTSHNQEPTEQLSAHSRSSSFGFSQNVADGNRDSQQSTKAGTVDGNDSQYANDNKSDNDSETIRPISKHSTSHSRHTNMYTDGGKHSGEWLFKPMAKGVKTTVSKTVKTIFKPKEEK
jgi:hypothetical protein